MSQGTPARAVPLAGDNPQFTAVTRRYPASPRTPATARSAGVPPVPTARPGPRPRTLPSSPPNAPVPHTLPRAVLPAPPRPSQPALRLTARRRDRPGLPAVPSPLLSSPPAGWAPRGRAELPPGERGRAETAAAGGHAARLRWRLRWPVRRRLCCGTWR